MKSPTIPKFLKRYFYLAAALTPLCFGVESSLAGPVDLGSAVDYAVVGVGGNVNVQSDFKLYQSATVLGEPHTRV